MLLIRAIFVHFFPLVQTVFLSLAPLIGPNKKNSVAFNPRANYTDRATAAGEISANVCGWRELRDQHNGSLRPYSRLSRPEPILFPPSTSSIVLTTAFSVTCVSKHIPESTLFNPGVGGRLLTQNVDYTVSHDKKTHSDNASKFCMRNYFFCDVTVMKVCTALKIV
jgi:hypothetical protein